MKFILEKPSRENIYTLIRKIGYYPLSKDQKVEETNCVRPLDRSGYPRFHIYLKTDGSTGSPQEGENLIFSLHLDQKKPIYKGAPAHAGEYDTELVQKETERIKEILQKEL